MPTAAPRPCRRSGCPNLVTSTAGFCPDHQRQTWRAETRARRAELRFYHTAAWRKLRAAILSREPLCRTCREEGRLTPATMVDHIQRIKAGGRALDPTNLAPLCDQCHAVKRGQEAHDPRA